MRIVGTGEPTLIFVHGYACAGDDWDRQLDALSKNFRCVALNLPGHGGSAVPGTASIEAMAAAVNKVKEQMGGGSVVLIGHSMGCRVVTQAYRQSPTNVAGLVFVDGSRFAGDLASRVGITTDVIDRGDADAALACSFADMFFDGSDPEIRQYIIRRALSLDLAFRTKLTPQVLRWDVEEAEEALKQVAVPTLVLQSTSIRADHTRAPLQPGMTTPWMDLVAKLVPLSNAKIITGAGHFTMIEAAPALNEEIARFAGKLEHAVF